MSRSTRALIAAILTFLFVAGLVAVRLDGEASLQTATPVAVRDILAAGSPSAAPGNEMQLVRYEIPPGITLPAHTHPGMQIAWIESGVLHYAVVEGGEIAVTRSAGPGTPGPVELIGPGEETDLHPGDSVVEVDHVVHFGANQGDEPVIILAATLLTEGEPAAIVVEIAGTPTTE